MRACGVGLAAILAACSPTSPAAQANGSDPGLMAQRGQTGLEVVPLTIVSQGKVHRFMVEVARTAKQQEIGMMFRRSLAPDRGMIFPYEPAQPVAFWMKNTFIPLDLVFIRADGTVARVAANAEPLSLDPIPSFEPVAAVLEIAGGRAAELGIGPGDKVSW